MTLPCAISAYRFELWLAPDGLVVRCGTEDEITGKLDEMKDKVNEKAGQVNDRCQLSGRRPKRTFVGEIQKKAAQIEKVFEK